MTDSSNWYLVRVLVITQMAGPRFRTVCFRQKVTSLVSQISIALKTLLMIKSLSMGEDEFLQQMFREKLTTSEIQGTNLRLRTTSLKNLTCPNLQFW